MLLSHLARLNRLIKIESTKGGHLWLHSRLFFRVKISRLVSAMLIPRREAKYARAPGPAQLLVSYMPLARLLRDFTRATAFRTHCHRSQHHRCPVNFTTSQVRAAHQATHSLHWSSQKQHLKELKQSHKWFTHARDQWE